MDGLLHGCHILKSHFIPDLIWRHSLICLSRTRKERGAVVAFFFLNPIDLPPSFGPVFRPQARLQDGSHFSNPPAEAASVAGHFFPGATAGGPRRVAPGHQRVNGHHRRESDLRKLRGYEDSGTGIFLLLCKFMPTLLINWLDLIQLTGWVFSSCNGPAESYCLFSAKQAEKSQISCFKGQPSLCSRGWEAASLQMFQDVQQVIILAVTILAKDREEQPCVVPSFSPLPFLWILNQDLDLNLPEAGETMQTTSYSYLDTIPESQCDRIIELES